MIHLFFLLCILGIFAVKDCFDREIPNEWLVAVFLFGLGLNCIFPLEDWLIILAGLGLFTVFMLIIFYGLKTGGADAKFMPILPLFLMPMDIVSVFMFSVASMFGLLMMIVVSDWAVLTNTKFIKVLRMPIPYFPVLFTASALLAVLILLGVL